MAIANEKRLEAAKKFKEESENFQEMWIQKNAELVIEPFNISTPLRLVKLQGNENRRSVFKNTIKSKQGKGKNC